MLPKYPRDRILLPFPSRFPNPAEKPRICPKPKAVKKNSMSIVIGLCCTDGVVLCADRQITALGAYKYHEKKINVESGGRGFWKVVFAYAGDPGFAREIQQRLMPAIHQLKTDDLQAETVQSIADEVLTNTSRMYIDNTNSAALQLFLAISVWTAEQPELLRFDGRSLYKADGVSYLGVGGETS